MSCLKNVLYVLIVAAVPVWAAAEFPTAPVDARAAEVRGLQRLDVPALKHVFSGTHLEQNAKGKVYRVVYGADGSVILSNTSGLIDRGTFSITRQNGGGVCLRLEQQMNQRMCAIWFRADDTGHLFGYNPKDGSLRAVSLPGQNWSEVP